MNQALQDSAPTLSTTTTDALSDSPEGAASRRVLPGRRARDVLQALPAWGDLVTIVLHGGCVFEYKGPFPPGEEGRGFYNLKGTRPGFEGHLRLDAIDHIAFQDRPHAGRIAHALTFNDAQGRNVFKVFLGREEDGSIKEDQLERYEALRAQAVEHHPQPETDA